MGKSGHYPGYTTGSEEGKGTTKATPRGSQGETLSMVYHGQREERDNQDDSTEKRGRHYPWYTTGSEEGQ